MRVTGNCDKCGSLIANIQDELRCVCGRVSVISKGETELADALIVIRNQYEKHAPNVLSGHDGTGFSFFVCRMSIQSFIELRDTIEECIQDGTIK